MPKPLTVWITTNWKILQEMGIPDHLICLLRSLYAGQEATSRTGHGTTDWFQIGKGVCQGYHPAYLIYMQSTSLKMPGWMKHKLESRLLGEISITSDTQMTPPLWQKVKRILFSWAPKSLWMVTAAMKLKGPCSLEEKLDKLRQHIQKQRHYFINKCP